MRLSLPPLTLSIDVDGPMGLGIEETGSRAAAMAALRQGTLLGAEFVRGVWLQVAGAMDIRGGFRDGGASYIQGIQSADVRLENETTSDTHGSVVVAVVNTSPHAQFVEEGHAAFSLAQRINWSSTSGRIKRGRNGPYLHIPFRHGAHQSESKLQASGATYAMRRSMMPADVYREAKALSATIRQNIGPIYRGSTSRGRGGTAHSGLQFQQADRYTWGQRLHRDTAPGIRVGRNGVASDEHRTARTVARGLTNPAWRNNKYDNLFRTAQPTAAGGEQSRFMTIRTITPNSPGWNIPAQTGRYVANRVAAILRSGETADDLMRIVMGPVLAALGLEEDPNGR